MHTTKVNKLIQGQIGISVTLPYLSWCDIVFKLFTGDFPTIKKKQTCQSLLQGIYLCALYVLE